MAATQDATVARGVRPANPTNPTGSGDMNSQTPTSPDPYASVGGGTWIPGTGWVGPPGYALVNGQVVANPQAASPQIPGYNTPPMPFGVSPPPAPTYATAPPFQAPSIADALNQPGYKFQLQQGENALQNWAAAAGTLNDSSTAQNLTQFAESAAQSDYQNVFNQALQGYDTNYQTQYADPNTRLYQNAQFAQVNWEQLANEWAQNYTNQINYRNSNIQAG